MLLLEHALLRVYPLNPANSRFFRKGIAMQLVEGKTARYEDQVLALVGKAKPKALDEVGYIDQKGLKAIQTGRGIVHLYYPTEQTRKTVRFARRMFIAGSVELVHPPAQTRDAATLPAE